MGQVSNKRVYVIAADGGGPVKIGCSHEPVDRLRGMASLSPIGLVLVGHAAAGFSVEKKLHAHFDDHRLHGEWFDVTPTEAVAQLMLHATDWVQCDLHGFEMLDPRSVNDAVRKRWQDPDYRARVKESVSKAMTGKPQPHTSERNRKMWEDPEYRAAMKAKISKSMTGNQNARKREG